MEVKLKTENELSYMCFYDKASNLYEITMFNGEDNIKISHLTKRDLEELYTNIGLMINPVRGKKKGDSI